MHVTHPDHSDWGGGNQKGVGAAKLTLQMVTLQSNEQFKVQT